RSNGPAIWFSFHVTASAERASHASVSSVAPDAVLSRKSQYVTPTAPSARTCTCGENAATPVAPFTSTGADHVAPPSLECATATPAPAPPGRRAPCHTTYSAPPGATAISGTSELSRTSVPVSGSRVPIDSSSATVLGADHVAPLSLERITRIVAVKFA